MNHEERKGCSSRPRQNTSWPEQWKSLRSAGWLLNMYVYATDIGELIHIHVYCLMQKETQLWIRWHHQIGPRSTNPTKLDSTFPSLLQPCTCLWNSYAHSANHFWNYLPSKSCMYSFLVLYLLRFAFLISYYAASPWCSVALFPIEGRIRIAICSYSGVVLQQECWVKEFYRWRRSSVVFEGGVNK